MGQDLLFTNIRECDLEFPEQQCSNIPGLLVIPPPLSSTPPASSTRTRRASRTWRCSPPRSWRPVESWRAATQCQAMDQWIFLQEDYLLCPSTCLQSILPTATCFREEEGRARNCSQSFFLLMS